MKERNELLEIWKDFSGLAREKSDRGKGFFFWKFYSKNNPKDILNFWTLKAKIDELKRQIIQFASEIERLEKGRERKLILPKSLLDKL